MRRPSPRPSELSRLKLCRTCRATLPLTSFGLDRSRADGHVGACRTCQREYDRVRKLEKSAGVR